MGRETVLFSGAIGGGWVGGSCGERQVDTLFTFSVDVEFQPRKFGEEAGVTVFLDETRHVDLVSCWEKTGVDFSG